MSSDVASLKRPRPIATRFTEPFWEGTRAGKLLVQQCGACQRFRWTPQLACSVCWSEEFAWVETSGRGTVYSFTVIHRSVDREAFPAPYVVAIVELEEGVHMLTNIVECELASLEIGMHVAVRFEAIDEEFTVYPFAPVGPVGFAPVGAIGAAQ